MNASVTSISAPRSSLAPSPISPVEEIVAELRAGRMVILVDEEDRESVRQIRPRAWRAMKLMASGVMWSAAMTMSPSFSRSSSSTRITMRPARSSATISSTEEIGAGARELRGAPMGVTEAFIRQCPWSTWIAWKPWMRAQERRPGACAPRTAPRYLFRG